MWPNWMPPRECCRRDWVAFVTRTTPWLQRAVYKREAWLARIGRWMDVRIARPNAYGWQTGVLLAKREK
jgi:hypothetical protein